MNRHICRSGERSDGTWKVVKICQTVADEEHPVRRWGDWRWLYRSVAAAAACHSQEREERPHECLRMVAQFGYDLHLGRCPSLHTHNHSSSLRREVLGPGAEIVNRAECEIRSTTEGARVTRSQLSRFRTVLLLASLVAGSSSVAIGQDQKPDPPLARKIA